MKKCYPLFLAAILWCLLNCACAQAPLASGEPAQAAQQKASQRFCDPSVLAVRKAELIKRYGKRIPSQWGERVTGVKNRLSKPENSVALTLDACGGSKGSGYDAGLIAFLEKEQVPATLFINNRWIQANPEIFRKLAANPLFEIENHGLQHRPCSVTGCMIYGIRGTRDVSELFDEIMLPACNFQQITGTMPRYFRPGTAYCDEVGVEIARELGFEVIGYSVLGDAGATYSREQVRLAFLSAPAGSIILAHMNHPGSGTREGLMDAIPELKKRGLRFVRLDECQLIE